MSVIQVEARVKFGLLTCSCILCLLDLSWAGDGQFFDVTGAKFDLEWASLDRIDSNGDYDVLNTRIMHVGLNCTKRECSNDLVLVP